MSRRPLGQQRVWSRRNPDDAVRPLPFLWPWRAKAFYPGVDDPRKKLALLKAVWTGSRNYAALLDALHIVTHADIPCAWVTDAARKSIAKPADVSRWWRRHARDLLDIIRAEAFAEGRYDSTREVRLSRDEAAQFGVERLRGTPAATSVDALKKLLTRMRANDARAFGRYYLGAGSVYWEAKYFLRHSTPESQALYKKFRHRAAVRRQ